METTLFGLKSDTLVSPERETFTPICVVFYAF